MFKRKDFCGLGFVAALLSACSAAPSDSVLSQNAKAEDPNTTVIRVRDNDLIRFVMVSNGKGYELTCKNPSGLLKLVDATGFPSSLLSNYPAKSIDSEEVLALKIDEQPKLDCEAGPRILYKSNLGGQDKYFFAEKRGSNTLYMFGCQALADAMGFDLSKARALDPTLIEDGIFDASDEFDINCLSGVSIGAKARWDLGDDKQVFVAPKQKIPTFSFSVRNPNGTQAPLTMTTEGACEWIQPTQLPTVLLINGEVPLSFRGQQCKVTITASVGTVMEDKRVLEFKTCANNAILGSNGQCYALVSRLTTDSSPADKGGVIYSPALDMADAQNGWFVGMVNNDGVVFGTKDGATWSQILKTPESIDDVAAVNKDIVWVSGGQGLVAKTVDGGKTWTTVKTGSNEFTPFVSAVDADSAWAATYNNVYKTVNGGQTWSKLNPPVGTGFGNINDMKFADRSNGYVLTKTGIAALSTLFATNDGGLSWRALQIPRNSPNNAAEFLSMHVLDANVISLISSAGYVYRSEDGGLTFSQSKVFGQGEGSIGCFNFVDSQTGFLALGTRILSTRDGGRSWGQLLTGENADNLVVCDFVDPSNGWFINNWGTVTKASAL
ncbi:MAG TPA: hypothetical protein VFO10_23420 [Oligoflexus sp.]|uniref:WD40/YVTN/BNR-like repeat-containing protein n=1 Tax=Oligoflexus sp. TaxID=1971216 RepID=UPI002D7ED232|nr:hypothetical protein [Oligoflexus sp.]HET9240233.1 hypothetical protein [Oligoflexus sp.]